VTDLADMEALVRLAKRYERLILHSEKGDEHTFVVDDAGSIYRYRARETIRQSWRQRGEAPASVPQQRDDPHEFYVPPVPR
jgi:glucose-6-phosphate 1-dehydrogenase